MIYYTKVEQGLADYPEINRIIILACSAIIAFVKSKEFEIYKLLSNATLMVLDSIRYNL